MRERMNERQWALFERIAGFDIDGDDPDFCFRDRLARESGWTPHFAQRVIDEYKRFVFLCCEAGHPCTPSEHVDQAWHLHLTYTKSYWERLCGDTLQRPLHHNPTRGGGVERDKFDDWYARTRDSYERFFGEAPPEDIWTPPERRFGSDLRWERVNLASHWAVPKRPVLLTVGVAALSLLLLGVIGCSTQPGGPIPEGVRIGLWWTLAVGSFVLLVVNGIHISRAEDLIKRWQVIIALICLLPSFATLLILLADRWAIPDIGIPVGDNNLWSIVSICGIILGLVVWATALGNEFFGGPRGGSGGGGCGGGCGGGGCGGGGCGGCGG